MKSSNSYLKVTIAARWAFGVAVVGLLLGLGAYIWRADNASRGLILAHQLAAEDQWGLVVNELEAYLRWHPGREDAIILLAEAQAESGDHLASARWWGQVSFDSPRKISALLAEGSALLASDRAADAEKVWRVCVAKAESDRNRASTNRAIVELVDLYWLQGRKSEIQGWLAQWADQSYRAVDLSDHLNALVWQLKVQLLEMAPAEGVQRLTKSVKVNETDVNSRRGLGRHLTTLGRYDEARAELIKCIDQAPQDLRNWEAFLALTIDSGELETAAHILQELPPQASDSAPFLLLRSQRAQMSGDIQAAECSCRAMLRLQPRHDATLSRLASILRRTNRSEELREKLALLEEVNNSRMQLQNYYARLQESWQPTSEECTSIARCCESLGYEREAFGWHQRAVALSPTALVSKHALEQTGVAPPVNTGPTTIAWTPAVLTAILAAAGEREHARPTQLNRVAPAVTTPQFSDVARQAGVEFTYFRGETGQFWIVEPNGGGAAWLDFDQDGWLDLFFVNGCQLPLDGPQGSKRPERRSSSLMLSNNRDGTFSDISRTAGIQTSVYGQGCTVADFDNDGFPDLYLTCYGANLLYHNCGDGTFQDVTNSTGTAGQGFSTGAAFMDLNRDGVLDLYVVHYLDFDPTRHGKPCRNAQSGEPEYCGPRCCPGAPDTLYQGRGDGSFEDVSAETAVASLATPGFQVVSADFNNDGWPDLYIANDGEPNTLLLNESGEHLDGRIRLRSCALEQGCALDGDGTAQGSMGVACGDIDRDGLLDLGVSNFYHEHYTVYRNIGTSGFEDVSIPCHVAGATRTSMGWGTSFFDYDNDGWLDLFVANGHINRHKVGSTPYEMLPQLFRNAGGGNFAEVGPDAGAYFQRPHVGRGAAFGDYDNDGLEDIVVVQHHEPAALLQNQTPTRNRALVLKLIGRMSNRDAFNARITATLRSTSAENATFQLVRELTPGVSYLSANDCRIRLGIPEGYEPDGLEVRWPSGHVETFRDLAADREYLLIEGKPPRAIPRYREFSH